MHYLSATSSVRDARKVEQLTSSEARIMAFEEVEQHSFPFPSARGGVLLGLVMSLHVMGYFGEGSLLQSFSGAAPSQQQRQRAVHAHVFSTKEHGYEPFDHHNMPDELLLWRASMFPQRPGIPIPRTPKVAFLFLTVGPLPLGPLWERFFHGHEKLFNIYVHSLPGFEPDHARSSVFFGRHIPSQETKWGEISMCDAERRLLANALLDYENERFVLLSESCAPLWNFTFTYDYLINSHHSFIGVFDDPGPFGRGRYSEPMLPEVTLGNWRKGAQWFEVNRELAIYIVSDTIYYPKFRDFCKPVCYVDEHYIPTMMFIQFAAHLANRSVTAVDWSRGGSHPVFMVMKMLYNMLMAGDGIRVVCTMVNQGIFATYLLANFHQIAWNPCFSILLSNMIFNFLQALHLSAEVHRALTNSSCANL